MIETAMKCPCGTHAVVDITASPRAETGWSCKCPRCYDPTSQSPDEEPSALATCLGYGATPEQAISSWWEMVERAWEIDYSPNALFAELSEQAGDEVDRQSGWMLVATPAVGGWPAGNWWAPKPAGVSP